MLETELQQFQAIIGKRTAARLELDRVLIRGRVPERYQAVQTYVEVLDRCIAELVAWSNYVRGRIEQAVRGSGGVPWADDPAWVLIRNTGVVSWVSSLRQERDMLARELEAIAELNRFPHEADEPSNGTAPDR